MKVVWRNALCGAAGRPVSKRVRAITLAALMLAGGAQEVLADDPQYSLSFLPDEQDNLICLNRRDAHDLLMIFHQAFTSGDDKAIDVMRSLEGDMGPDRRFDCGFIESIYVPQIPLVVVDVAAESGLEWGDKPEHFFVRSNLLIDGQQFTGAENSDGIYAFTWDFVITKD